MVRELSAAENNKYLQVADCVLSSVNVIGSYLKESTSLVETYNPYKVGVFFFSLLASPVLTG